MWVNWYLQVLRNYANFNGRARRKEFWFFTLFQIIISIILILLDLVIGTYNFQAEIGLFSGIYTLLTFIPSLAVSVRRLHDINFRGWWVLLFIIPIANLILLVLYCFNGTVGNNRFGADPKADIKKDTHKTTLVS